MTATIRITHIATGSAAIVASVVRADGVLVSEHTLLPGEIHNVAVRDGQRILVIEPAPPFAQQLARWRDQQPPKAETLTLTESDLAAAMQSEAG